MNDYPQRTIRHGRASASWGARHFGQPRIVVNAPLDAMDDLLEVVRQANTEIAKEATA